MHASVAPAESYEIAVTAKKWAWSFTYPTGATTSELHVPAGRPVKLLMSSQDVLHSFFVPEFRVKQDVVPGSYTSVWFHAIEPGEFTLLCTEYCGTAHSSMLAKVVVHEEREFQEWLEGVSDAGKGLTPVEFGQKLYTTAQCNTCHSVDGRRLIGPTWQGIYNAERRLRDGTTVIADENYLRDSILNPAAQIVEGYPPVMPSYKGQLRDAEIDALIAYMKTL
jgi:cytochrome c oxidase subunit II